MRNFLLSLLLIATRTAFGQMPGAPYGLSRDPNENMQTQDGINYYLACTLTWTNGLPLGNNVIVQSSGDGGATWTNEVSGVHNSGTVLHVYKGWQNTYKLLRVVQSSGSNVSPPSNILPIWGEEQPATFALLVDSTNQVELHWKNQTGADENGFLLQRSTNADFSTLVDTTSIGPGTNGQVMYATNYGFLLNVTYYWRVAATNSLGYMTEWTPTLNAAPASAPGPTLSWQARNGPSGVLVTWNRGTGAPDAWYVQASVGSTNSFATVNVNTNSSLSYSWNDTGETPGNAVYYRILSSNVVGVSYSTIQLVQVAQSIAGNVWYIDAAATGNGTGTNWANAWPNFASISWLNLNPGAVVWVAPGNYPEIAYCSAGGTTNLPLVFKLATTNAPHGRGKIILQSLVNNTGGFKYITLDGALDDNFQLTGYPKTQSITNNCGWQFVGNTNIARAIYSLSQGMVFKWLDISGPYVNSSEFGEGSVAAIYFAGGVGIDSKVGYCWVHDMTADNRSGADGIDWGPASGGSAFGGLEIYNSIVERVRDNFIAGGGSVDIHDNILRDWAGGTPSAGHPDSIQNGAGYWRIYNNIIRDTPGSCIYPEIVSTNTQGVFIYNNLIYGTGLLNSGPPNPILYPGSGIQWSTEPNLKDGSGNFIQIPVMTVSNVLIGNNTFFGFDTGYQSVTRRNLECGRLDLRGWLIANNLFVTHSPGSQVGGGYSGDDGTIGTNFGPSDIVIDWNDVTGTNQIISWQTNTYTPSTIGVLGFSNNISSYPSFSDLSSWNFHLQSTNLIGTNLSAWNLPGLNANADGTLRNATGWPIGALSSDQGAGLVLWLSFNGWDGISDVPDASGSGHTMLRYNVASTNWPTATNGPNGLGAIWITPYRYGVITNWTRLSLTNGTIAMWGRYSSNAVGDSVFLDFGSTGYSNCWHLGRDNSFFNTRLWVNTDNGTTTNAASFPDFSQGVDSGWHHYAVTWTGGIFTSYFDASPIATNSIPVSFLAPMDAYHWAAVGCYNHNGTPDFTDNEGTGGAYGAPGYPNNGWTQGGIADVRIYNNALSASDIAAVKNLSGVSGGSGGGGGGPPVPAHQTGGFSTR